MPAPGSIGGSADIRDEVGRDGGAAGDAEVRKAFVPKGDGVADEGLGSLGGALPGFIITVGKMALVPAEGPPAIGDSVRRALGAKGRRLEGGSGRAPGSVVEGRGGAGPETAGRIPSGGPERANGFAVAARLRVAAAPLGDVTNGCS